MMAIFLLVITLNVEQQYRTICTWICSDVQIEAEANMINPNFRLDLMISRKRVSGTLKVYREGSMIRVSDLVGVMYSDGSVSLAERWVDGKDIPWIPNYSSILITDINAPKFGLHYNSASKGQSHKAKGQMIFNRISEISRS